MIKILTATDGKNYFVVCGKNGEVIVTSEQYESLQSCKKSISALKRVIKTAKTKVEK